MIARIATGAALWRKNLYDSVKKLGSRLLELFDVLGF
jgi:hypothetical protein